MDRTPPTGQLSTRRKPHTLVGERSISGRPLCLLCLPRVSAPGVFLCVRPVLAAVSHTSDHLEEQWRSSPQPLYVRAGKPPRRDHAGSAEKRKNQEAFSRALCTHGRLAGCVDGLSWPDVLVPVLFNSLFYICTRFLLSDCQYAVWCILNEAVRI